MNRKIRGLEDSETQERKRLFRDVRSPIQQTVDGLKLPAIQTGGVMGAGVCLFFLPAYVLPIFLIGMGFIGLRYYFAEHDRLPFRMPLGNGKKDLGDPLPGRRGFAKPEGIFFLGNRLQDNGFDIEAAHRIVALIEKRQGWKSQKKARYKVDENNQAVRNELRKKQPPSSKAQDFENYTGEKSAQRIAQQKGRKIIEEAKSWEELHKGLKEAGLRFEKKGSGGIVFVGDMAVKASSIDRQFSMDKLCKRLGEFKAGDYSTSMPKIEPEPVTVIAEEQWREYRKIRLAEIEARKSQKAEILNQQPKHKNEVACYPFRSPASM